MCDSFAKSPIMAGSVVPNLNVLFHTEYKTYPTSNPCIIKTCLQLEANLIHESTRTRLTEDEVRTAVMSSQRKKIIFVLDMSDSMEPNIFLLKQIMNKVAETVQGDSIGIVTFDTETHIISPLKSISKDEDRISLRQSIRKLRTGGCTDLCAGILKGMDVLWEEKAQHESERRFMVILTDGVTNSGITDALQIQEQLDKTPHIAQTDVYCMALGSHVNQDLLQTIVMTHSGRLYALESTSTLSQTFGDCMGSIMSTLFTNVKVGISSRFPLSTSFRGKTSKQQTQDKKHVLEIELGTMFIGDMRDVMVTIELPLGWDSSAPIGSIALCHDHHSMTQGSDITTSGVTIIPMVVEVDPTIAQPQHPNPYVIRQQMRVDVASIMEEMSKLCRGEDAMEALKRRAKHIEDEIRSLGWQDDPLCRELLANLTQLPTMPSFLCRAASAGLTYQRQTSVTDAAHASALYTTSLQRSLSNHYASGNDANDPHEDEENMGPIRPVASHQHRHPMPILKRANAYAHIDKN